MDSVSYDVRDRIAHVTIDDGKRNALSFEVLGALADALTAAEDAGAEQVGALLISGRDGTLSGGFDLNVMRAGPLEAGRLVTDGGELFSRMYGSEVPIVIACTGHAIAAGALLMLAADERICADDDAIGIGLIETQIGMVLPRWAVELAEERLSRPWFQRATVAGKRITPREACEAGFVDAVVDRAELAERALAAARYYADLPRAAYKGQVLMCRGDRLGRLAEAVAADRGRLFDAGNA
ncbi:MAG TPA: crotonase/enoyl-CoA hydratase family protein [Acidimicrobiia bacterium]|nr:crotonase/enoyl-CoA hydratase family protein [Acidimicrobiia bacterium]